MSPFDQRFPECAAAERLVLHIQEKGLPLPPGEYAFFEWYCEDAHCDCRRALLQVISPQRPGEILATINFGWESEAFYTRWMHGDAEAGREITNASLDPLNPNSELADALLEGFRDYVRRDSFYPQQLRRHYEMFKSTQTPASPCPSPAASKTNMTPDEILRQFQNVPDKCDFAPYQTALLAAAEQRDAITPELIAALDRVSADPAHYFKRREDCLHLFAIYLLAQFRETRALDAFLRFFSLPGEQALDLTGDMVTENGAAVLVSVCGGDSAPLLRLARDEAVNQFVRGQAIDGLLVQGVWGERPREAVIADLRSLFATLPKPGDACVWAELVCAVNDFNALELLPEVRRAFAENLVDEGVIGLEDIDPAVKREPRGYTPPSREELYEWFCERNAPIDAVNECSGWLCFRADEENGEPWDDEDEDSPEAIANALLETPLFQPRGTPYIAPSKVGRNDPCPCGSGKKYKKCCGK
jgi:hypothetical protein